MWYHGEGVGHVATQECDKMLLADEHTVLADEYTLLAESQTLPQPIGNQDTDDEDEDKDERENEGDEDSEDNLLLPGDIMIQMLLMQPGLQLCKHFIQFP